MKLFIISTPSQAFFLSKTSAVVDENSILLITKNRIRSDKEIIAQLKVFTWFKIFIWNVTGIDSPAKYYKVFLFRIKLLLLQMKYHDINEVYIGSYDNLYHLGITAAFENRAKLYLLYDGLQIISVAEKRAVDRKKSIRSYSKLFKLAGFTQPFLKSITYTSPLEFKVPSFDRLIMIESSFNKSVLLNDNLMYFAGQPLVDMDFVSLEYYLFNLNAIKVKFSGYKIIYIPHPKESNKMKAEISKILEIQYFETIFEEEYLNSKYFARNIVSFYSSVLINLYYIAREDLNIYAIALDEEEILRPRDRKMISQIYKYFRSNKNSNFNVIKF